MTPTTTSTCPRCGGAVLAGDRFCGSCGTLVAPDASSGPRPAATTPFHAAFGTVAGKGLDSSPWGAVAARLQNATQGEFEILTELGRGGMAAVYLARDLALNRRVAIKVMSPGLLLGPGMVERFRQEAVTVANLQHAHIVSIHAVRQLDDLHFFVMQFVPGRTLEGVLREGGALPIPVVRAWLYQIGSALGYAHRRGVIHRDIKPGNILLNADGEAVVTDFGIAKVAESPSHTQTGTVVGTPVYMSPEQCFAKELTGASDQYSLGVVAYEMLAGKPPFTGSSFGLMRAHTDDPPPPLREARTDVPAAMEAALMRMLAKRPADRFPTLSEALVALGAIPIAPDDPLHGTLHGLAAAAERLQLLGDILRTPMSPVPKTRERDRAPEVLTPRTPLPVTETLVVAVAPPPSDLEPGATAGLRATVKNAVGQSVPGAKLQWMSSAPDIVSVDAATGRITALAVGNAVVTVTVGTAQDAIDVVVGEATPATISITVPPGAVKVGERIDVSAVVTNRYGVRVARPVAWSVDERDVAVVETQSTLGGSPTAVVRGVSNGSVGIIATCGSASGRAGIRVLPAPAPVAPPAPPPPIQRVAAPPPPVQRIEAPPPPVQRVEAPPPPVQRVEAPPPPVPRVEARVDVPPPPMQRAEAPSAAPAPWQAPAVVAPPTPAPQPPATPGKPLLGAGMLRWAVPVIAVLAIGAWYALKSPATSAGDSTNVPLGDSTPVIAVDSAAKTGQDATVRAADSSALAVRPPDTTTVRRPDSATVAPRVARRIEVAPATPDAVTPGQTINLSATARDAAGARMRDARVLWSSADQRVATVDATGLVRAIGAGSTRVSARVDNVSSSVMISVVPPPPDPTIVATIDLSDIRTLTVGETTRVTATARNAAGAAVSTANVDWSSSNPDVATVSGSGTVSARGAGTATIRATAGGRSADRSVTVRAREVVVTRPDTPITPSNNTPPAKTEAELRSEISSVIATYARAIESRDTSAIRRLYPSVANDVLTRWQVMFSDARSAIRMTGGAIELLDPLRDAPGAQVRTRTPYTARFASRAARTDQALPLTLTVTLQRDGGAWRIIGIR